MLAADKLQLQSALKQQATALKEKEFNLHHSNLMTVGTQAAVLAGLDITMFIEFNPPGDDVWGEELFLLPRLIKLGYYITIVSAFCANMIVVSHTTALSVLGAGMALRGPDGSMMVATDGLYEERKSVFFSFGLGLACTVGSVVLCVWLLLNWEAALICMFGTIITCHTIWKNYIRVSQRFNFNESDTVDFRDIMEGPAAIQAIPSNHHHHSMINTTTTTNRWNGSHNNNNNNNNNIYSSPSPMSYSIQQQSSSSSNNNNNKNNNSYFKKSNSMPMDDQHHHHHHNEEQSPLILAQHHHRRNHHDDELNLPSSEDIEMQQLQETPNSIKSSSSTTSRRRFVLRSRQSSSSPETTTTTSSNNNNNNNNSNSSTRNRTTRKQKHDPPPSNNSVGSGPYIHVM